MDDGELLKAIKADDQTAFQILFEKYARYAAAVAAKVGGNRLTVQDVEEICSDVFVTLWKKRNAIVLSRETLKPYIGILAKNKTLNALRTDRRTQEDELFEHSIVTDSSEEQYLRQEEAAELMEAINTLSELDRELFIRRYFYLEKVTDIAQDRNINVKTVSARILKARHRLELVMGEAEVQILTEQVDFARVQKMTMDRIQEEPQNRKVTAGRTHWRNSPAHRIAALAAVLVICLGGTVFAVQKGYFEAFFGIDSVSDGQILRVNESRLSEGVKMTLAEVIPGETDGVVTIAFQREDGKPFPENVHLAKFDVALGEDYQGGYGQEWKLSEDGRQLLACIEMHGEKTSILGKTLTIDASTIYSIDEQELEFPVDLAAQYDALPIQITADEMEQLTKTQKPEGNIQWGGDIEAGTKRVLWSDGIGQALAGQMEKQLAASPVPGPSIPMSKGTENPDIQFAGLGFVEGKLCLGVSIPEPKAGTGQVEEALRSEAALTGLLDRRNGRVHLWSRKEVYPTDENRAVTFTTFEREGLTEEDLAYLTPLVTYEDKECISKGQWKVAYTFDKSVTVNLKTDLAYNLPEGPIQITDISISVLDVKLYGKWNDYVEGVTLHGGIAPYNPEVKAIMKDGTEIVLEKTGASAIGGTGEFFRYIYVLTEDGSREWKRRFIDEEFLSRLEGMMVDGTLIPLENRGTDR